MSALDDLRATAHPIRLRLLSLLTGVAMSAAEAGRELGLSQATASYHLRVLERVGLVEVTEVVRIRGGEAKRYRHLSSARPFAVVPATTSGSGTGDDSDDGAAADERASYVQALADELSRRSPRRTTGPQVSTDAELWVDAETWHRVVRHVGHASALLHAAARRPRTPGTSPVSMTAALFPMKRP
ncbi:DNA-binding transcriptional ArsR family regulator [Frigoribacterium sp. PvP054]|uniref:ArsR/SmtB family transcription factor n=1 Tax=Frigoribacterium sp. PvP054 TaxID=3156438 RepID=UPI003396012A